MEITIDRLRNLICQTVREEGKVFWIVAENGWGANPFFLFPSGSLPEKEWIGIMKNLFIRRGFNSEQIRSILSALPDTIKKETRFSICLFSGFSSFSRNFPKNVRKTSLDLSVQHTVKTMESLPCISFFLEREGVRSLSSISSNNDFHRAINQHKTKPEKTENGEENIMGKSTPTFRELVQIEAQKWSPYTHALSRQEKVRFERLFKKALFLSPAASEMAGKRDPFSLILMNLLIEMEGRIETIEEAFNNPSPPQK